MASIELQNDGSNYMSISRFSPGVEIVLGVIWFILLQQLMIADIWDETSFLVYFYTQDTSLINQLQQVWSEKLANLYRPLPVSVAMILLSSTEDLRLGWWLLRHLNILLLVLSFVLLWRVLYQWQVNVYRRWLLTLLFFYASSTILTATWYANIFDAMVLFFFSLGLWAIARQNIKLAAVSFSLSFFCKEISIIIPFFLIFLIWHQRLTWQQWRQITVVILGVGGFYWILRLNLIAFGSAEDVHTFDWAVFPPSFLHYLESFWWQTLKQPQMGWLGLVFFVSSFFAFVDWRDRLGFLALIGLTSLIYWGMFSDYQTQLISHLHFIARLYLLPATLILLILTIWGRLTGMIILLIPVGWGAMQTYWDHYYFQQTYAQIYQQAEQQTSALIVYHPYPLDDPLRGLKIGLYPQADVIIDTQTGAVLPKQP